MTLPIQNRSELWHLKLQRNLFPVAKRLLHLQQLRDRSRLLLRALYIAAGLALLSFFFPAIAPYALASIFFLVVGSLVVSWKRERRQSIDYLAAAQAIEAAHPELKQSLVTSIEQELLGRHDFFTEQTAKLVLDSPTRVQWQDTAKSVARIVRIRYLGTLTALLVAMLVVVYTTDRETAFSDSTGSIPISETQISVEPGDLEIERGSSVVITARVEGKLPETLSLEVVDSSGQTQTYNMARSLSDPVFAYSLRQIKEGLSYRVTYAKTTTEDFQILVYDLPDLVQANAKLRFPSYTQWEDRAIEDTLRISAIEGSELDYQFYANKALDSAYLVDEQGKRIALEPSNDQRTQFSFSDTLTRTKNYKIHLVDTAGRSNPYPPELRIDAIPNQRPNLRLDTPRGDQRLSPIEEVTFSGTASDDFGLLDYGVGFVIAAQTKEERSLFAALESSSLLKADFNYLLALEKFNLEPKESVSWYLWADDFGPDGKVRRSTGDLYFANIRSLDEIFREQDGGGGGQGGQGNQGLELIEKQRRIVISLFRIKNSATDATGAIEDIDIVQRSQFEALNELMQIIPELTEPSSIQAATSAQRFMEGVDLSLVNAIDTPSLTPLEPAWADAQSAYQELVKLSENEFNVSRSQNQQSGSGGGASRNQSQLDELDFRQEENRYETASEAQPLSSPEDRQNLELISKLNELSRRQDDMNDRLQEMQNALADAQTDEERERIERELKRLEEEQREMLADADEAIQKAGNRESTRQARQQLEQARENMQRATTQLGRGEVSQALASGTRAQDTLEDAKEQMREQNSSEFSEAMRQARSQARELAEEQRDLEQEVKKFGEDFQRRLDDSESREKLAQKIDQQAEKLDDFLDQVRQIAEGSENVEPGLFRKLYQVLRDSNGSGFEERYQDSAQFLRQGFLDEAQEGQEGLASELDQLSEAITEAAESILGNESTEMEFAKSELENLREQLQRERDESSPNQSTSNSNSPGSEGQGEGQSQGSPSAEEMIRNALADLERSGNGPITGGNYNDWVDRLRTVESLIDEPLARSRISEARETAENMRRDFKRRGELPQWDIIENEISAPLNDVSSWLASELNRIENPDSLQPVDSDPIPEDYSIAVQRYYESLGND